MSDELINWDKEFLKSKYLHLAEIRAKTKFKKGDKVYADKKGNLVRRKNKGCIYIGKVFGAEDNVILIQFAEGLNIQVKYP